MASLGWVTPGAATEGVTPLFFFLKNLATFFAHRCHYRFLLLSLGCHPLYLSDLVSPLFFCKFAHKIFSCGCHPPGGCDPERSAPPPPPSDATVDLSYITRILAEICFVVSDFTRLTDGEQETLQQERTPRENEAPHAVELLVFDGRPLRCHREPIELGKTISQLSQRDRAAGWVSYGQSGRLELGDNFTEIIYSSIFNQCDVFGQQNIGADLPGAVGADAQDGRLMGAVHP